MKTSPHKEWIKVMLKEMEILNKCFKLDMNKIVNMSQEDMLEYLKPLKGSNMNHSMIAKGINALNIFRSLINAKEVYIKYSAAEKMISEGAVFIKMNKLPFSDMVITMEDTNGNKYLPRFFSVFEKIEKYIHEGKKYPIICIKSSLVRYNNNEPIASAELEFHITGPMLPRIFITCPKIKQCDKIIRNNILKKSDGAHLIPGDLDIIDPMCQKTLRTLDLCMIKKDTNETFAKQCFDILIFVNNAIERLSKIPEKIIKEINGYKLSSINEKVYEDKEPVIYIKDKTYQYVNSNQEKRKLGYNRESPCEHLRRGHWRHYKNGKKVWVEDITVSKDNKKPTKYILK